LGYDPLKFEQNIETTLTTTEVVLVFWKVTFLAQLRGNIQHNVQNHRFWEISKPEIKVENC